MTWTPADDRYERMLYRRCGASGVMLPAISLGLWHNFGEDTPHATKRAICRTAFDHGITHFDLANNYGPPPGATEEAFGEILAGYLQGTRYGIRADADGLIAAGEPGVQLTWMDARVGDRVVTPDSRVTISHSAASAPRTIPPRPRKPSGRTGL